MVVEAGFRKCTPTLTWAVLFVVGFWFLTFGIEKTESSVVIHATAEHIGAGVVRRTGLSLADCAAACAKEKEITCRFFKYLNETRTCLLSATDSPKVNRVVSQQARIIHPITIGRSGRKSITSWIGELEEKIDELEDQESDIETLKSAVTDIRDELKMLRRSRISEAHRARAAKEAQQQAYTQLTRKIVGLKVDGEKFKAAVHALSNMQRVLAKEIGGVKDEQKDMLMKVAELEKATGDLNTLASSLRATDSALQRELDSIKDGTNDLANKFSKLRDRLNQEIARQQMPPAIVKLKHNQGALATALETMTDKVSSLMGRLPFLERELRGTNQKVSNQAMYERELQSKLKVLYKNLIEVKKSVHSLLDPRSAVNMERAKGVLKLKSDVSMLAEMDKGLKNELEDQREDMARLVKDVARVQLMAQNLKDKLTLVLTASRQFQQDITILKDSQKNELSVVEVAQMQKQVLVALNRLKTREAILMKQLNKYRSSVKKVANQVARASSRKTHTHQVVLELRQRLNRFDKQMQLLFDKTKLLTKRLHQQPATKGMGRLIRSQARTNSKVIDLLKQLEDLREHVSLLSMDLQDAQHSEDDTNKELLVQEKAKRIELQRKAQEERDLRKQERRIDRKIMKKKQKQMERKRKRERSMLKKRIHEEARSRQIEEDRSRELRRQNLKLLKHAIGKKGRKHGKKRKKKVKTVTKEIKIKQGSDGNPIVKTRTKVTKKNNKKGDRKKRTGGGPQTTVTVSQEKNKVLPERKKFYKDTQSKGVSKHIRRGKTIKRPIPQSRKVVNSFQASRRKKRRRRRRRNNAALNGEVTNENKPREVDKEYSGKEREIKKPSEAA